MRDNSKRKSFRDFPKKLQLGLETILLQYICTRANTNLGCWLSTYVLDPIQRWWPRPRLHGIAPSSPSRPPRRLAPLRLCGQIDGICTLFAIRHPPHGTSRPPPIAPFQTSPSHLGAHRSSPTSRVTKHATRCEVRQCKLPSFTVALRSSQDDVAIFFKQAPPARPANEVTPTHATAPGERREHACDGGCEHRKTIPEAIVSGATTFQTCDRGASIVTQVLGRLRVSLHDTHCADARAARAHARGARGGGGRVWYDRGLSEGASAADCFESRLRRMRRRPSPPKSCAEVLRGGRSAPCRRPSSTMPAAHPLLPGGRGRGHHVCIGSSTYVLSQQPKFVLARVHMY